MVKTVYLCKLNLIFFVLAICSGNENKVQQRLTLRPCEENESAAILLSSTRRDLFLIVDWKQ